MIEALTALLSAPFIQFLLGVLALVVIAGAFFNDSDGGYA